MCSLIGMRPLMIRAVDGRDAHGEGGGPRNRPAVEGREELATLSPLSSWSSSELALARCETMEMRPLDSVPGTNVAVSEEGSTDSRMSCAADIGRARELPSGRVGHKQLLRGRADCARRLPAD